MSSTPAERARKCFALAASTPHVGERDAAIERGIAIIKRHGLNADDFKIPGRSKSNADKISAMLKDQLKRMAEEINRKGYDAVFSEELRRETDRFERMRRSASPHSVPEAAAERLSEYGWRCVPHHAGKRRTWSVFIGEVEFRALSDSDLIRIAAEKIREQRNRHPHYYRYEESAG